MIREYALEPSLLNRWDTFREVVAVFSLDQGRMISEYPKLRKWKRMVKAAYEANPDCMPVERLQIAEKLNQINPRFIRIGRDLEDIRPYPDAESDWYENATSEHRRSPFHAIVATENRIGCDRVICWGDWDSDHVLLRMENERIIERQANSYVECLKMLVKTSREIKFVDRFFDPSESRYEVSCAGLLPLSYEGSTSPDRVEIHCESRPRKDANGSPQKDASGRWIFETSSDWKNRCESVLAKYIPLGEFLHVFRWRSEPRRGGDTIHARYVMTEKGGFRFDHGLDEGSTGETTDVSILNESVFRRRWQEYQDDGVGPYILVDEIDIEGIRTI